MKYLLISLLVISFSALAQSHGNPGGGPFSDNDKKCDDYGKELLVLENSFMKEHTQIMHDYTDFTELLKMISLKQDLESLFENKVGIEVKADASLSCGCDYKNLLDVILTKYKNETMIRLCPAVFFGRTDNVDIIAKIISQD